MMNITLRNRSGMCLTFSPIGATWLSCQLPLPDHSVREVLLSCQDPQQNSEAFIGATIGRYSNRINQATITCHSTTHLLDANQGQHQLHGGSQGFHTLPWQVVSQQANRVIFGLISPNEDQGFPGQVYVTVDIMLTEQNAVMINYLATTDQLTPLNLTNHAYFNLDGQGNILGHQLYVDADYYLPVTQEGIPIDHLSPVEQGDMDLRELQPIAHHFERSTERQRLGGYDHAYLLNQAARTGQKPAAKLVAADRKVTLEVFTNKPAIQVYTGNHLQGIKGANQVYQNYSGIALETEFLPDSPNRPDWPHESCWLAPNQFYCYTTTYQFYF